MGLGDREVRTSPLGTGKKARANAPAKGSLASLGIKHFAVASVDIGKVIQSENYGRLSRPSLGYKFRF